MRSYVNKEKENQFTILDILNWAVLPLEHQYSAIAARLIDNNNVFPIPILKIEQIVRYLSNTTDKDCINKIIKEIARQVQIKISRLSNRGIQESEMAIGCQLSKKERVNRLAYKIFGDTSKWLPIGKVIPRIYKPYFNWLHKSFDGTVVAGVDDNTFNVLITGFVFQNKKSDIIRFGSLPKRVKNITELFNLLGLHPRLMKNNLVKIDWKKRGFAIGSNNYLPWVY
jgi:hypothetical protein